MDRVEDFVKYIDVWLLRYKRSDSY